MHAWLRSLQVHTRRVSRPLYYSCCLSHPSIRSTCLRERSGLRLGRPSGCSCSHCSRVCPLFSSRERIFPVHIYFVWVGRYFVWDTLDAVVNFVDIGFVLHGESAITPFF